MSRINFELHVLSRQYFFICLSVGLSAALYRKL